MGGEGASQADACPGPAGQGTSGPSTPGLPIRGRLGTRMPSFMSSPRMRSAPQRQFSFGICWIKATVSDAARGRPPRLRDLNHQNSRKPWRWAAEEAIGLEDEEGFRPSPYPAGEEHEPEAVGWGEAWLADLAMEEDELLAEGGRSRPRVGLGASGVAGKPEKGRIPRKPGEMQASQFQRGQCGADALDKPAD